MAAGVAVHFEGLKALDGVDLEVRAGEIMGLIGPNGAGKTTMVNVLSGFQLPTHGRVEIAGRDATGKPAHRFARMGVARTFQGVRPFRGLTVQENVEAGAVASGAGRARARLVAQDLLERLGFADRGPQRADALPHGDERRLGIIRALATDPDFLLLDEPAAGLNEIESDELIRTIRDIRDQFSCGVLVIEHDMRLIMGVCERIHVLDYGGTIGIGTPDEVRRDPKVISAYLGNTTAVDGA